MIPSSTPLLEVRDLRVDFAAPRVGADHVRAVAGVSLEISSGETLGLVGESGSGKSTIGNAVLGLAHPTSGQILFEGKDITRLSHKHRQLLSTQLQVVFQDPNSSLNPSRTIAATLSEPLRALRHLSRNQAAKQVADVLRLVGLPTDAASRYPAHFSGGQRQRIAIARALILGPSLIICDEPTSALDLSVQAQILNLLLDLQRNLGLAYLFISHDIDVVRHMSHRVAVLFHGEVVEQGAVEDVTTAPSDPYTKALLAAAPVPDPQQQASRRTARAQSPTSPVQPASTTGQRLNSAGMPPKINPRRLAR